MLLQSIYHTIFHSYFVDKSNFINFFTAYNGSLISSLTSPTLAQKMETNLDVLGAAKDLRILTHINSAADHYMLTTSDQVLRRIKNISVETGWNNYTGNEIKNINS